MLKSLLTPFLVPRSPRKHCNNKRIASARGLNSNRRNLGETWVCPTLYKLRSVLQHIFQRALGMFLMLPFAVGTTCFTTGLGLGTAFFTALTATFAAACVNRCVVKNSKNVQQQTHARDG